MAGQNKINFEVGFQVNSNNLKELQSQLTKVTTIMNNAKASGKLTKELEEAGTMAKQLSSILETSFNRDLGTVNISKFNQGLKQAGITSEQVRTSLIGQGNAGVAAYAKLTTSILNTNIQLKEQNKLLNSMATTMVNTVKWGAASSILNTMTGAIRDAYSYSKQLDSSLTSIRIVTGDSADQMARFAEQANTAAKNLGANTLDYTKSALAFYQQGLDDEAVANRTEATIKAANVTGSRAEEVAQNLTAVWNGFQAEIGSETEYVDKLAAVADSSASNLAELATAMSKVASVANNMGVDMDQLTAQISTIIATTRQAPETVGNALKTIYARINDIKTGSDEAEISLGNYTGKMASLGINVLDATGHLRDTGEVMEEIGSKWGSMGREQQIYLAQTMAGQRQMNNLVALFDNWAQYSDMLNVSLNAQGALDEKNNRYLESTQAHLNELKSTYQGLYATLINTDELNAGIDTIRNLVQILDDFLEGFGGGIKSITAFGSIIAFVFRDQIGQAIGQFQVNSQIAQQNLEQWATKAAAIQAEMGSMNMATAAPKEQGAYAEAQINQQNAQKLLEVQRGLTAEKQKQLIDEQAYIGEQTKEMAIQEAIKNNALQNETLKNLELQAEQSYASALEEELSVKYSSLNLEEGIQAALQSRVQEIQTFLDTETAVNAAGEELAWTEELKTQLLNEQKQLMIDIEAISKAQVADEAEIARSEAEINVQRAQGKFDRETDYAATVARAKANTDLWLGSITTLTMAWGGLSSIVKTFTDENASGMEKFSRILMTLGFTIPMIASSISKVRGAISTIYEVQITKSIAAATATGAEAVTQETLNTAIAKGAIVEATATKVKEGKIAALTAEEIAQLKELSIVETGIAVYIKDTLNRGVNTNSILLQIAAKTGLIAVTEGEIVTVGALLAAYLPVVAVIGAVVAVGYALAKSYDAQADRAKAATEAATAAKNEAKELSEGYSDLKTSLEQLNNARSTLNGLKKGTEEWNEAVIALNEQMLQLLETYPELAKYLTNEDGVLTLSQQGQEEFLAEQLEKAQAAQDRAIAAQANASKEQGLYEAQQLGRETGTHLASPEKIYEAAQIYAQHSGEIVTAGDQAAKVFSEMADLSEKDAEALLTNTSALLELNATAQGIKTIEDTRADNAFKDNEDFQNSEYQDKIRDEYNKRFEQQYNQEKQQYSGSTFLGGNLEKTQLAEIYQELTGITLTADELKNTTKEQLADEIASYKTTKALAEETDNIIKSVEEAGKNGELAMNAFERRGQEALDKFNAPIDDQSQTIADRNEAVDSINDDRILKGEDNISAIQGALTEAGMEMEDFFTKMPDGTYKLSMAAEDFKKIIDQISLNGLGQQVEDLQNKIDILDSATQAQTNGVAYLGDTENAQHQVDLLTTQGYDAEKLGEWQTKIDSGSLTSEDYRELAAAASLYKDKIGELKEQSAELKNQAEETAEAMRHMVPRDDEVDLEQLNKLSDYLEENANKIEDLADGLEEADYDDIAESLLRYKDAIEDITENYDDWIDAINNGDMMEQAEAIDAVRENMSDLLDLPFDGLSDDFVTTAENMDLMRRAAQGDEEAYNQLAEAARQDIAVHAGFDDAEFQAGFQDLMNKYYEGQNLDDLEVGASLNNQGFLDGLTDMVNAAGMTAEQATDYLASMGVDAQVIESNAPTTEQKVVSGWDSQLVPTTAEGVATIVSGAAATTVSLPYEVYSQVSTPHEETITTTQDNKAASLKVTSAHKSSGGGFKHTNAGGGGRKGSGGGGGGKKGGGGGKGKKAEPAKKKKIKNDPYHDVNDQLKESENRLKKLQKEEKKLTGKEYLENLRKQNEELERQRRLVTQKNNIAKQEMQRQLRDMQKDFGNIFNIDSDGYITNYVTILENAKKQVDEAYQEQLKNPTEENKQKYEYVQQRYSDLKQAMDDYTKEADTYWDQVEKDIDLRNEEIENKIKAFNYTIDLHLETADFEKDWKEFRRDVLEGIKKDDFLNLSSFELSGAKDSLADSKELIKHIQNIQSDIKRMENGQTGKFYTDNIDQAYKDLEKYTQELMEKGKDIRDAQKEINDNWLDSIDAAQDAFDEQLDKYENINDIIEHNLKLLDMLYGDEAYNQAAQLYEQQANNTMQTLQALTQTRDFWRQQMEREPVGSDAWKEYYNNWKEQDDKVRSETQNAAEAFYNAYSSKIKQLGKELVDALKGGNAELWDTQWEQYGANSDRYLDAIQRNGKAVELQNKYQDALANASLKQQKEINKLMDTQLNYLNSQTETREIDYQIAEKELELLLKRQALEDAQNNKTKMRLRRDSQGNYRYQYVADKEAVDQAQRELAATAAELYELTKEDYRNTVEYMNDINEQYMEKYLEIYENSAYTIEEKQRLLQELYSEWMSAQGKVQNDYMEMSDKLIQHTAAAATIIDDALGGQFQQFANMPDNLYQAFEESFAPGGKVVSLIDGLTSTIWKDAFSTMPEDIKSGLFEGFGIIPQTLGDIVAQSWDADMVTQRLQDLEDLAEQYQDNIHEIATTTGQDFDNLNTNMSESIQTTQDLIVDNNKLVESYGSIINKLSSMSDAIQKVIDQYRKLSEATVENSANQLLGNSDFQNGTTGVTQYNYGGIDVQKLNDTMDSLAQALYQLASYDTGGYTGPNPSPRLAILHGEEYVLNKEDTPNVLNAVQFANNLMSRIADVKAGILSEVGISNLANGSVQNETNNTNEQNIIINADFPAAESAAEIKQALTELVNLASQRASGNRRTY